MNSFIEKLYLRIDEYNISKDNIYLIYDEESLLSKYLWEQIIEKFNNVKILKLTKDRLWNLPNKEEIKFVNNISWICFLFFSDKWLDFKNYFLGKKLRDYLLFSKWIYTIEVWRLKYFNTEELQKNILFCLSESISKDIEFKWFLLENKINLARNIIINDSLFYEWQFEDVKYNFWLYKWKSNSLNWSLYPVWEVLLEPKDLKNVNWKLKIYAFPDINNSIIYLEKTSYVYIKDWFLVSHELWEKFDEVLLKFNEFEKENNWIIVREMGFSINKNIKREFMFPEISSAEKNLLISYIIVMKIWCLQQT